MDNTKVEKSLENIDIGFNKYVLIMDEFHKVDVSEDMNFQTKYNGFYRMRQRKAEFYKEYFNYMQINKTNKELTYAEVLTHFYNKLGRIEASFCSKLLATINPYMPVWDSVVIENLKLKKPAYYSKNRLEETIDLYEKIKEWYYNFLKTNDSKEWIELFDSKYKGNSLTDVKKVDLILWQIREE